MASYPASLAAASRSRKLTSRGIVPEHSTSELGPSVNVRGEAGSAEVGLEGRERVGEPAVGDVVVLAPGRVVVREDARERHVVGGDPIGELIDEVWVVAQAVAVGAVVDGPLRD